MSAADQHVQTAAVALARGDFDGAVEQLEAALLLDDDPRTRRMLGGIHYADDRFAEARAELEAAFVGFRRLGEPRLAALVAADLAELHSSTLGNPSAGNGWLARARRELAPVGPCVEWGYVELAFMACDRPDTNELLRSTERALALAAEFGDGALEVRALADSGLALVTQGRVREGFDRLDAALAAVAAGEIDNVVIIGKAYCSMLSSCDRVGDVRRAEEWTALVQTSLLEATGGRPRVLHTHCRAAYGSVLSSAGRWTEAEAALLEVLGPEASASFGHRVDSTANLAALRVEQGRLTEAAELLAPFEDRASTYAPLARMHLVRGEPELAAALLRRGIDELVGDVLRGGTLLALLVDAELALGDVDAAAAASARLASMSAAAESDALAAESALARGRIALAGGDTATAVEALAAAAHAVRDGDRPLLAGTVHLELAEARARAGDDADAVAEARAALAVFERLGAAVGRDRALAQLRRLGVGTPARPQAAASASTVLTAREAEVLELLREGLANSEIAARLYISPKTAEHHVSRILAKLGVRSRAEAAAVATAAAFAPGDDGGRE